MAARTILRGGFVIVVWAMAGCSGGTPPLGQDHWVGFDGWYFPDTDPHLYELRSFSFWQELRADDFSIVTWPELETVPSVASELDVREELGPVPPYRGTVVWRVTPTEVLSERWYAMRWSGPPPSNTILDGVLLADGSRIWRFDEAWQPQLHSIAYSSSGSDGPVPKVILYFRENPRALPCAAPVPVISVTQGSIACTVACGPEERWIDYRLELECAAIDPSEPFRVEIRENALVDVRGRFFPAVDVMVDRSVTLPRRRPPPPVPEHLRTCSGGPCP